MRAKLFSLAGFLFLSFAAEKCRQLVGEEYFSSSRTQTGRFAFTNCFDMSYGTVACLLKETIKLYLYYIRAIYIQKVKTEAAEKALTQNLSKRQDFDQAEVAARQEGKAAARRASRHVKHVMGPMLSALWDLFETVYAGGSLAEGVVRSVGTFVAAYVGGLIGEGNIGWLGIVVGSQLGSWIGGRIGLMVYDVWSCAQYLLHGRYLKINN